MGRWKVYWGFVRDNNPALLFGSEGTLLWRRSGSFCCGRRESRHENWSFLFEIIIAKVYYLQIREHARRKRSFRHARRPNRNVLTFGPYLYPRHPILSMLHPHGIPRSDVCYCGPNGRWQPSNEQSIMISTKSAVLLRSTKRKAMRVRCRFLTPCTAMTRFGQALC